MRRSFVRRPASRGAIGIEIGDDDDGERSVGDRGGRATVQSPIKKQAFGLDDGVCLDDADVALPVYPTRIVDGHVHIGA